MMAKTIKVVIVEDQPAIRRSLRNLIDGEPDLEVVGEAANGEEGLKVCHLCQPDVITLDLEMPKLDGFGFLRLLMAKQPRPVVVVSSHATRESVFRALELGAVEFCAKPSLIAAVSDLEPIKNDLLCKLRNATKLRLPSLTERMRLLGPGPQHEKNETLLQTYRAPGGSVSAPRCLVCIGASTGGPTAIAAILQALPPKLPASVLITQHLPNKFTAAFVQRLRKTTDWPVREADPDAPIAPGEAIVASPIHSLCVFRDEAGCLKCQKPGAFEEVSGGYVPSIDRMMSAAAQAMGANVVAVILSGMSGDGVFGSQAVAQAGGRVLVESPQSAVLSSMPEAVIATGATHDVAPLSKLASLIIRHVLMRA